MCVFSPQPLDCFVFFYELVSQCGHKSRQHRGSGRNKVYSTRRSLRREGRRAAQATREGHQDGQEVKTAAREGQAMAGLSRGLREEGMAQQDE